MKSRVCLLTIGMLLAATQLCLGFGISILAKSNGQFVHKQTTGDTLQANKTGVGSWGMFDQQLVSGSNWALKCTGNNMYLHVYPDGLVKADSATCTGTDTQFQFVSTGDGWGGIKCVANQCYMSTYYGNLYAWRPTIASDYEKFQTEYRVDVWSALNGFAWAHPNCVKITSDFTTYPYTGPGWGHPSGMRCSTELCQNGANWWYWITSDYRYSQQGIPGYDKNQLEWEGDWEMWSISRTEPYFNPDRTGDPNAPTMCQWTPMIPRTIRYFDPNVDQLTARRNEGIYLLHNNGSLVYQATGNWGGRRHAAVVRNYSNSCSAINMGNRWVVDIELTDQYSPNGSGEVWTLDLGPAPGAFAPEFGFLEYRNQYGSAVFNNVQNKDADVNWQNMWYTNFPIPVQ